MLSEKMGVVRKYVVFSLFGVLAVASCKKDSPKSNLAGFTDFAIKDKTVAFTIDEGTLVIQNADSLPYQTDVSALTAVFTVVPLSVAQVGGVEQVSGTTVNNFTSPITYDVVAQDGVTKRSYTVRVNVSKVDPNTVAWNQVTSNAGWTTSYSTSVSYLNKFWFIGKTLNSTSALFTSPDATTWTSIAVKDANGDDMPPGLESTLIPFNNKMFILGGHIGGFGSVTNKIWSSTDGSAWDVTVPGTGEKRWTARQRVPAAVFQNKLWVIGGSGYPSYNNLGYSGTPYADIWSSSNGTTWDSVIATPAFTARSSPAVVVYKDKLWLIGGRTGAATTVTYLNDVWSSSDGKTWTQVTTATAFTPRWGHKVIAYNNELFLVGGETVDGVVGDMWTSSDDGVNWTKIESGNPRALPSNFAARAFFSMFVQDNTVWIAGGRGVKENSAYTFRNDIWKGKLVK